MHKHFFAVAMLLSSLSATVGFAQDAQLDQGKSAIEKMTGCYLVDYSYVEVEALKPGYIRDPRVYDVNMEKSVKEWIYAENISPTRVRLQHVLFATDLNGRLMEGSLLKHTGEDWEYNAPFIYDFASPDFWTVRALTNNSTWTRKVTNLDDGLRYQCASTWSMSDATPEWNCSNNYAPIPGRETRDMGRRDYQALMRSTRVVVYGNSWLERQNNIKTIHAADGTQTPLARELGKNWYVRLPDSECADAQAFTESRREFWRLLREVWDEFFVGDRSFHEVRPSGQPPRYFRMVALEERFYQQNLLDPSIRDAAKAEIRALIEMYRER